MNKIAMFLLAFTMIHCGRSDDGSKLKTVGTLPGPTDAATNCGPETAAAYRRANPSTPSDNGNTGVQTENTTTTDTAESDATGGETTPSTEPAVTGGYSQIALTSNSNTAEPCRTQNGHVDAAGDRTDWAEENAQLNPLEEPTIGSNANSIGSDGSVPEPDKGPISSDIDIDDHSSPTSTRERTNRTRGADVLDDCTAAALALLGRYDYIGEGESGDCEGDR